MIPSGRAGSPDDLLGDQRPDPLEAQDAHEFAGQLRLLKAWAGNPSFEHLARLSGVPRSTLADAMNTRRGRLPRLEVVGRLVAACGLDDEGTARWKAAWRLLSSEAEAESQAPPHAEAAATPYPAMLPPDIADFSGRKAQARFLASQLRSSGGQAGSAPAVVVVSGRGGVGKTTLAVHVAHQLVPDFPDGQLYADLRGADGDPRLVLGRFLRMLGADRHAIPAGLDERAGWFRSLLGARRVLVVLDDVASAAQVRPLIPGSPACAMLVTSRARLADLAGACRLHLEVPDQDDALGLLAAVAGQDRAAAEPEAAAGIIRLCGCLPLALRIAGARLASRPHWSLQRLAGRLADQRRRLDELAVGDLEVRACLALSYRALEPGAAQAFCLLATLDAASFASWAVAPLLDVTPGEAENLVETLVETGFLDAAGTGADGQLRFQFHELVRLFGRERAAAEYSSGDRRAALARALGAWLSLAERAAARLPARERPYVRGTAPRWPAPAALVGLACASPAAWFGAEQSGFPALVAQAGRLELHEHAWELAAACADYLDLHGYHDQARHVYRLALAACEQAGNALGEAVSLLGLSLVRSEGSISAAQCLAWTLRAAELFGEVGQPRGQAKALELAAYLNCPMGRLEEVVRLAEAALPLARISGSADVEAYLWYDRGLAFSVRGSYLEAEASLLEAVRISRQHGLILTEAAAQYALGSQQRNRGNHGAAQAALDRAVALAGRSCHASLEALALADLADTYARLDHADAAATADRALACCAKLGIGYGQALALAALSRLRDAEGRAAESAKACAEAIRIARGLSAPYQRALALGTLGGLQHKIGPPELAADAWRAARVAYADVGNAVAVSELDDLIAQAGC